MNWIEQANNDMARRRVERQENPVSAKSAQGKWRNQLMVNNPESLARQRSKLQELLEDSIMQSSKGKKGGKSLVASGQVYINLAKATEVSHAPATCVHCGKTGNRVNIVKKHNDNCQLKPEVIMPILHAIPTIFVRAHLIEQFKKAGIEPVLQRGIQNHHWFDVIGQWGGYKLYSYGENYYKYLESFPPGDDACDIENGLEEFLQKRHSKRMNTLDDMHLNNIKALYNELPTEFTRAHAGTLSSFKDRALMDIIKDKSLVDSYRPKKKSIAEGCPPVVYVKKFDTYPN